MLRNCAALLASWYGTTKPDSVIMHKDNIVCTGKKKTLLSQFIYFFLAIGPAKWLDNYYSDKDFSNVALISLQASNSQETLK